MRKLMWFTIGFAAACGVGAYLVPGRGLIWLGLCCLVVFVGLIGIPKTRFMAAVALGCAVGVCWFQVFDLWQLDGLRILDGHTVSLSAEVTDYSYETRYGTAAADAVTVLNGKRCRVRLYTQIPEPLWPGDQVEGLFRLQVSPGSEGVFLLAYHAGEATANRADSIPTKYFPAVLRADIRTLLAAAFPEDTAAFAVALLLGDTSGLSYAQDTAFKVSGIRHVVAVSGLHVSILFSLVYMAAGKRRGLTTLFGIPILLLFAAVAGFTPSVTRACVMQILMILALLLGREYDPPTALASAALIMLVVNPLTIVSVSFQLSCGCMIGIFLFSERIRTYLLRKLGPGRRRPVRFALTQWIAGSVSVTVSAMAVTVPLCAGYFGMVSLVGVLTNLLTLWVISFIFYDILLVCLTGALWLPLGRGLAWLGFWPIRYVYMVARGLSFFPWAAVYTCSSYTVLWLVFSYVLFGAFLLSRKKRPAVLLGCVAFGLCLSMAASWLEPRLDAFRVTVLDVGQGQCILLQSRGGDYLVDCGGDSDEGAADAAAELLLSQGVNHLDGLILTHFDRDHAGGAEALLSRIHVDAVYTPVKSGDGPIAGILAEACPDKLCRVERTAVFTFGGAQLTLFPGDETKSNNESSLGVLFQAENCDILITGDRSVAGEAGLLAQTELPKLEVLVVGHHGANDATGLDLLRTTTPDVAVISVGMNNPYGHPTQAVLDRLEMFGCQVRRTDLEGTIVIRG